CVEGLMSAIVELDETGIFDPVRLRLGHRKDHALADLAIGLEYDFDAILRRARNSPLQVRNRRKSRDGVDRHSAIGSEESRAECQRGHVAFPDSPQAEDEASPA